MTPDVSDEVYFFDTLSNSAWPYKPLMLYSMSHRSKDCSSQVTDGDLKAEKINTHRRINQAFCTLMVRIRYIVLTLI